MPPFGEPRLFRPELERYAPLERTAIAVAGNARTPYAAAVALMRGSDERRLRVHEPAAAAGAVAPLVDFVTRTHAGYCQHFAGAMALMLRYLGVPARVAVGFTSGTYDAKSGVGGDRPRRARLGRGLVPRLGLAAVRPDALPPARSRQLSGRTPPPVRAIGGAAPAGARGLGPSDRANPGTGTATRAGVGRRGRTGGAGGAPSSHGSLLRLLALVLGARCPSSSSTKFAVRRARYLTRDPRRLAAACRRELADYLLDQRIDAARSATLHELGALVRHELSSSPTRSLRRRLRRASARPTGARAARDARRELRALPRRMRALRAASASADSSRCVRSGSRLMHAVVMAAGRARLRPLTERWPKPVSRSTAGR